MFYSNIFFFELIYSNIFLAVEKATILVRKQYREEALEIHLCSVGE